MTLRNKALINSAGSLVLFLGQWVISVIIVRITGYGDAGIFSLAMSISNVFCFIANYNIRNYQISDVNNEFTQKQYLLSRITTIGISIIACAVYLLFKSSYSFVEKIAIALYLLYSNINVFSDTMMGSLQKQDRLEINGYSNILRGVLCCGIFIVVHILSKNILLSLLIMTMTTLFTTFLYDWRYYRKSVILEAYEGKNIYAIASILKKCFPLMVSTIFPVITTAIPRSTIHKIFGEETLGYFSSIFTPTAIIVTLAPALILSFVPKISDEWNKLNLLSLGKLIALCYGICAAFTVVSEVAALLAGRPVMTLVFGESILPYYNLLYWAIAATGVNAFTSCGNAILIAMRKRKTVAIASLISTAFAFFLSNILIKNNGIYGAAYLLLIAYGVHALIQIVVIVFSFYTAKRKKGNLSLDS